MNREDAIRWHQALASSAGSLSGSLARGHHSRRLVQDILSMLRPVVREMETDDLQYQALENIEKEKLKNIPQKKRAPERVKRK